MALSVQSPIISDEYLKNLLHPTENSRLILAISVSLTSLVVALILSVVTFGIILPFIAFFMFSVWFATQFAKAILLGNSVKVSSDNFPEIHAILTDVKKALNYEKSVEIYIIEEGSVNALLYRFFRTRFIVLNSQLVTDMLEGDKSIQLRWIIARFVGALKAKHLRVDIIRILIDSVEGAAILNVFLLPYERATQYSGDQIGLAVCGDLRGATMGINKFLVGNELAPKVQLKGILSQAQQTHFSFLGKLSQLVSTHPHTTNRYVNLLAFAKYKYPEMYEAYRSELDSDTAALLEFELPKYLPIRQQ